MLVGEGRKGERSECSSGDQGRIEKNQTGLGEETILCVACKRKVNVKWLVEGELTKDEKSSTEGGRSRTTTSSL